MEAIYQRDFADGKWSVALRAKEMQAKIMGLFKPTCLPEVVRIADMNQGQLAEFIARLVENEPELKNLDPLKPDTADQSNGPGVTDKKPPEPESREKDSPTASEMLPLQEGRLWQGHNTDQAEKQREDYPPPREGG